MVVFPHSKINLGLNVLSKRGDGYHDIETCFYPLPWYDLLEIVKSKDSSFTNTGICVPGKKEDNICVRAYHLMQDRFDLSPVAIHLHKIVPMGAGLGGGSADAAFTLLVLNNLFDLNLTKPHLEELAAELGSDCAFFIHNEPMIGTGRGEKLKPVSLSLQGKFVVVVKPDIHVTTAEAFKNITPRQPYYSITSIVEQMDIKDWKDALINDFEKSVFVQFPKIEEIKLKMYQAGALYASMSGSGSSVFGIFQKPLNLENSFPEMSYWSGTV
jgi:4-diphosphocytidyl-2-C-methyl-D-erythritol kinase